MAKTRWRHFVYFPAILCLGSCHADRDESPKLPNIIVITLDTLRADHLGCFDYFRNTSPRLDRLAKESIFFTRCLSPMSATLPSHVSLFTGTNPIEHGVLANVDSGGLPLVPSPKLKAFASVAEENGYLTAGFVSSVVLKDYTGIATGFDYFSEPPREERRAAATNQAVFKWLSTTSKNDKPLFLWVHYYDVHAPYRSPRPFNTMFTDDDKLESYLKKRKIPRVVFRRADNMLVNNATNRYDGEIKYLDRQIGKLLHRLKAMKLLENAAVVVVGDHGEGLCQHDDPWHGYVYDEQLHVPLMMRVPGVNARKVTLTMSIVDIFPTLLSMIPNFDGEDFLRNASGHDVLDDRYEELPVFSKKTSRELSDHPHETYVITTNKWKYLHQPEGKDELYHLQTDPFELQNVLTVYPQQAKELKNILLTKLAKQIERASELQATSEDARTPLDPKILEQLKSLGYLD